MQILPFKIPDKMVYITIHEYTDVHHLYQAHLHPIE